MIFLEILLKTTEKHIDEPHYKIARTVNSTTVNIDNIYYNTTKYKITMNKHLTNYLPEYKVDEV